MGKFVFTSTILVYYIVDFSRLFFYSSRLLLVPCYLLLYEFPSHILTFPNARAMLTYCHIYPEILKKQVPL
jgi:hypothetical protein